MYGFRIDAWHKKFNDTFAVSFRRNVYGRPNALRAVKKRELSAIIHEDVAQNVSRTTFLVSRYTYIHKVTHRKHVL